MGVVGLAALVKVNTLRGTFVWDDDSLIVQNVHVRSLRRVPEFFLPSYWRRHHMTRGEVYRPIRLASFALDCSLWGLRPAGFHLTNGLLHLANVALVCLLLRRWGATRGFWLPAALLFAVRPTDVETVAWIKNRSDLFAAALFLSALLTAPLPLGRPAGWGRRVGAALLFAAALMAKEVAIGLPVLLMAVFSRRRTWRRDWAATIPFWLVAVAYLVVRAKFLVTPPATAAGAAAPGLLDRVAGSAATLLAYGRLFAFPARLTLDYGTPGSVLLSSHWGHVAGAVAVLAVFALNWRVGLIGLLWFGIALFPVSNIIPLRDRPLAEQRLYLAVLGPCAALAAAAWRCRSRKVGAGLIAAAVVASCALAVHRAGLWSSNIELWRAAVRCTPSLERPLSNFGNAYSLAGRHDRANTEYRRALRANPRSYESVMRMGKAQQARGKEDEALERYRTATSLAPRSVQARYAEAALLRDMGRRDEAIRVYDQILEVRPRSPDAWHGIALVRHDGGDVPSAIEACEKALALDETHYLAHRMIGVLVTDSDTPRAVASLTACIDSNPHFVVAYIDRARALCKLGQIDRARADLKRAIAFDPRDTEAWGLLDRLDRGLTD